MYADFFCLCGKKCLPQLSAVHFYAQERSVHRENGESCSKERLLHRVFGESVSEERAFCWCDGQNGDAKEEKTGAFV